MTHELKTEIPLVDLAAQFRSIREEICDAVDRVLESAQFVGGHFVESFEDEFAHFVQAKYAVGVASGTAALELALKAVEIGRGDEVVVPANTFFATAEAVSNVGATPVFADIDPATYHLDVTSVARAITPRTRAVIPVHLYGRAMRMTALKELAQRYGFLIIEDAAQAHGSKCNGVPVGGAGRLTCFSFYPGKNLGAYGEAGAVTCDDVDLVRRLRLLREHGSPVKYAHAIIGTNSRLDAIQAAVLSVKLRHLPEWNQRRVQHAERYVHALQDAGILLPDLPKDGEHNHHLFVIRLEQRDRLRKYLQEQGICTGIHYPIPLHLTEAYQRLGYPGRGALPQTELLADEILSLPMYPELTAEQQDRVTGALLTYVSERKYACTDTASAAR